MTKTLKVIKLGTLADLAKLNESIDLPSNSLINFGPNGEVFAIIMEDKNHIDDSCKKPN